MNWYKVAITKKEFYEFYALQGLDDETLRENPDFLLDLIERINYIHAYYCKYLITAIASEVGHSSSEVKIANERYYGTKLKDILKNFFNKFDGEDMSKNLNIISDLTKLLNIVHGYFLEAFFRTYYGGQAWAEIVKWTIVFLNLKPITYENLNFENLRKFIMVIDIINSLEHNTNFALTKLPQKELFWLPAALEVVKSIKNPVLLADLANNNKLSKLYRRQVLPLTNTRESVPEWVQAYDDLMGHEYVNADHFDEIDVKRQNYIRNTNNLKFLEAVIDSHLESYFRFIMYNPNIYGSDRIFQKFIDNAVELEIINSINERIQGLPFLVGPGKNIVENIKICDSAFEYLLMEVKNGNNYDLLSILSENKKLSSIQANKIFDVSQRLSGSIYIFAHLVYPNILDKLSQDRKAEAMEYLAMGENK